MYLKETGWEDMDWIPLAQTVKRLSSAYFTNGF